MGERRVPLKAVTAVRIRSGLPPNTRTTRPLTCANDGQGPCRVSDGIRSGPAVGEYLCPIRARVRGGVGVSEPGRSAAPAARSGSWSAPRSASELAYNDAVTLAGRALDVPVASASAGPSRSAAVGRMSA